MAADDQSTKDEALRREPPGSRDIRGGSGILARLVAVVTGLAVVAAVVSFIWETLNTPLVLVEVKAGSVLVPPEAASYVPVSAVSRRLNSPAETIGGDLRVLVMLLEAYRKEFGEIPSGENPEVTAALRGKNGRKLGFISPDCPAVASSGVLLDRWGTPYRFQEIPGGNVEVWAAGPDAAWDTDDDARRPTGRQGDRG